MTSIHIYIATYVHECAISNLYSITFLYLNSKNFSVILVAIVLHLSVDIIKLNVSQLSHGRSLYMLLGERKQMI